MPSTSLSHQRQLTTQSTLSVPAISVTAPITRHSLISGRFSGEIFAGILKGIVALSLMLTLSSYASAAPSTDEAWKPSPHGQIADVGAMVGAASFGTTGAFAFLVTGDATILPQGWLKDVSNQVDLGIEIGPVTFAAGTATMLNAYLKWDFLYSEHWTFFGLGGVGSLFLPSGLGGGNAIYPHLAIGTQYYILPQLAIRAEISHAFTGVGATFSF